MRSQSFTRASMVALACALSLPGAARAAVDVTDDPILFWNQQLVAAQQPGGVGVVSPPAQTRIAAILNIAMHDAANSALGNPRGSYVKGVAGAGGDVRAAVSQAAFKVLSTLDPTHMGDATGGYVKALNDSLSLVSDAGARTAGIQTGDAFATKILSQRANDVMPAGFSYAPGGADGVHQAGEWQPAAGATALLPWWGTVHPFVVDSVDRFKPAPPPAPGSPDYEAALAEVRSVGAIDSPTRTAAQTDSAKFWAVGNGLLWTQIALGVAEDEGFSTIDNARAFALMAMAQADGGFTLFNAKYDYELWRPNAAINETFYPGCDAATPGSCWQSLIGAPPHPSYASAHSTFSEAAADVLMAIYGDEALDLVQAGIPLHFDSLGEAAMDAANSRIWGGIHYRFDSEAGLLLGDNVARYVLAHDPFAGSVPEPASWAMMILGFGITGWLLRRRDQAIAFA